MATELQHTTRLGEHLREIHLWLDVLLLAGVWIAAYVIPENIVVLDFLPVAILFKIVGLVGALELLFFLTFHLLDHKKSLLLQGFFGGFISSTAVFMQLTANPKFAHVQTGLLGRALLLAVIAMLLEALLIVYTLAPHSAVVLMLPIAVQLLVLVVALLLLPVDREAHHALPEIALQFDHPIFWKNVLRFSLTIFVLILAMRWLGEGLQLPYVITVFLLSLFEAHGVLAAAMIEVSNNARSNEAVFWVVMILLGNLLSKSLFIVRRKNKQLSQYVIAPLVVSYLLALPVLLF